MLIHHILVVSKIKTKIIKNQNTIMKNWDLKKLELEETKRKFSLTVENKLRTSEEHDIEKKWINIKTSIIKSV